ncbi:3-dehydroquinate dehydratase [Arthrobacter sp. RIT-PI-e]|uniref:type II 3-dehydroquinate dehydratase n=1 Tax=Arthrobacter sp. RIT-PI-e TaxID=1681197 RepID=UPI000675D968|nr:type II 3-dehydroquinate dehydratase [Arthrobacter sp. RIT-PI-e]KNC17285.1 3-dehydroquinate dehydratase [Arthrobacter sp. RIT-PI-e]
MSPERTPSILVVNGPNLNLLGTREPAVYGSATLDDVIRLATETARAHGCTVTAMQSNHEGVIIDAIHAARPGTDAIVINAGALTHTSIAIRDALAAVALPVVEVHISNVHRREEFRHVSYISGVADAVIVGAGIDGYRLAVDHLASRLTAGTPPQGASPGK